MGDIRSSREQREQRTKDFANFRFHSYKHGFINGFWYGVFSTLIMLSIVAFVLFYM